MINRMPSQAAERTPLRMGSWVVLFLFLCVFWVPMAAAQDDEFEPDDTDVEIADETDAEVIDDGEGEEDGAVVDGEAIDFGAVDDLLAMDEEVLSSPDAFTYDPGARRDPFRSLLRKRRKNDGQRERPDGIPGLLIAELRIEGIFILDDGPVAQVKSASERTSFLLRPGDELWDGDVVRITLGEVVFKQSVNDPTALKPFREVVKRLNPSRR